MIVNIASVLAIHSMPVSSVYSGTKGFVLQLSRGLQQGLGETGMQVRLVLPASRATRLWDELRHQSFRRCTERP
jgi:short-subunit dehydrogenase